MIMKLSVYVSLLVFLSIIACKVVKEEDNNNAAALNDYKLESGDISPWTKTAEKDFSGVDQLANDAFNGRAYSYEDNWGLDITGAFLQSFSGTDNREISVYCIEFSNTTQAQTAFAEEKTEMVNNGNTAYDINGFDNTTASLLKTGGDYNCLGVFDRFYVIMFMYGFQEVTDARSTAYSFLALYEKRSR
ncbi:MAG: hypothetical protein GF401_11670 [Chitinivibrionales bacterium]|nr:hypothetical protein [Chitinivibrionales bacterium]